MRLSENEAFQRLLHAARALDAGLSVDRGSVHWVEDPVQGVFYGLVLGDAHALLFMPAGDIAEPGWEGRLSQRMDAAYRYLRAFPPRGR